MFAFYCLDSDGRPASEVTSLAGVTVRTLRNTLVVEDKQGYHENKLIKMPFPIVLSLESTGGSPIFYKDVEIVAEQLEDATFFHVQCAGDDNDYEIVARSLLGFAAPSKYGEIKPDHVTYLLGLAVKWGVEVPTPARCAQCDEYSMLREVVIEEKPAYACVVCCARNPKQVQIKA